MDLLVPDTKEHLKHWTSSGESAPKKTKTILSVEKE